MITSFTFPLLYLEQEVMSDLKVPSYHYHVGIFPNWDSGAASHNKRSK